MVPVREELLDSLDDCIEDVRLVFDHFRDEGETAITELISCVKYLIAVLVDIFSDGLADTWLPIRPRRTFFFVFCSVLGAAEMRGTNCAMDDFDRGLVWLILQLNAGSLSNIVRSIQTQRESLKRHYSSSGILLRDVACERLCARLRHMEQTVAFDVDPASLFATHPKRRRASPKSTAVELEPDVSATVGNEASVSPPDLQLAPPPVLQPDPPLAPPQPRVNASKTNDGKRHGTTVGRQLQHTMCRLLGLGARRVATATIASQQSDDFEDVSIGTATTASDATSPCSLLAMKICPERGLQAQNFCCSVCGNGISMTESLRCDFSGEYMCPGCHGGRRSVNPVRILRNWDFARYSISEKSRRQIVATAYTELVDLCAANPQVFRSVAGFGEIDALRRTIVRLTRERLGAVDKRQREKELRRLEMLAWPKTHLLHDARLYTMEDLVEVHGGCFYSTVLLPLCNVLRASTQTGIHSDTTT